MENALGSTCHPLFDNLVSKLMNSRTAGGTMMWVASPPTLEQASLIVIASLCPLEQSRDLPNILSPIRRSATSNDVSAHRQQIPAAACVRDREGNHHMCARQMVTTSFPGEGNCNIIRYEEERRVCLHAKTLRITNDDALISIRHVVTRNGDIIAPPFLPTCRLAFADWRTELSE